MDIGLHQTYDKEKINIVIPIKSRTLSLYLSLRMFEASSLGSCAEINQKHYCSIMQIVRSRVHDPRKDLLRLLSSESDRVHKEHVHGRLLTLGYKRMWAETQVKIGLGYTLVTFK